MGSQFHLKPGATNYKNPEVKSLAEECAKNVLVTASCRLLAIQEIISQKDVKRSEAELKVLKK